MKNIRLNTLTLKNFKGIKELVLEFSESTNIYGNNATGKTTIADAFRWLLVDKDSRDRQDFEIKTIDAHGDVQHGLEHSVKADIHILVKDGMSGQGSPHTLEKTYKEKWTKKRGSAENVFTGHETIYMIDEVPVKKSEYQEFVNDLIPANLFKIFTDPLFFSEHLGWKDRRKILIDIVGDVADSDVVNFDEKLRKYDYLFTDDIDTIRKRLSARKKKINEELKSIPHRIDELNNSIEELDFASIETSIEKREAEIRKIDEAILNASESPMLADKRSKIRSLRTEISGLRTEMFEFEEEAARNKGDSLREKNSNIYQLESKLKEVSANMMNDIHELKRVENFIATVDERMEVLRKRWSSVKSESFEIDRDDFVCPVCKRAFEKEDTDRKIQELERNFNEEKARRLSDIDLHGKSLAEEKERDLALISRLNDSIQNAEKELAELEKTIQLLKDEKDSIEKTTAIYPERYNEAVSLLEEELTVLEEELSTTKNDSETSAELIKRKAAIKAELISLRSKLAISENNKKHLKRIEELKERERTLAQELADCENEEFACENFIRTKVELLERKINSKFNLVNFKLFDEQINGGLQETCVALIEGVPFTDANHGSQINAGLDIINTLSNHFQVAAPIIIDNAEAITSLISVKSQLIRLVVSEKDIELRIENLEEVV